MKILCVGDSWTQGTGVNKDRAWPAILQKKYGVEVTNAGVPGTGNMAIADGAIHELKEQNYDLVIAGWSGVTRYAVNEEIIEFSYSEDIERRDNFFKNKSISHIEDDFNDCRNKLKNKCKNIKFIEFSVFGDFQHLYYDTFTKKSYLDLLAEAQGCNFKYNIPFFEFDFLSDINLKNTTRFAKRYFPKNWARAIVEREDIRPGEYFLACGHPNAKGHELWASYLGEYIFD